MLEIALRRTHSDKLEMFKWRSEFIALLSAQPGPLVEREWRSISSTPANTGSGVWTGMTWWENQQRWHDMANMIFPTPISANWAKTIDMTLVFVKPLDDDFNLRTLAQSSGQVLELGLLVFPKTSNNGQDPAVLSGYLHALEQQGAKPYRFSVYPNPSGFNGPLTVAYKKDGGPIDVVGETWAVYMVRYDTLEARSRIQADPAVRRMQERLTQAVVRDHSDIEVMTRTTSQVCIKKTTGTCSLDPDDCHVGVLGSGDTWAATCSERPQPCVTDYNVCSQLSPRTCLAVGGKQVSTCSGTPER